MDFYVCYKTIIALKKLFDENLIRYNNKIALGINIVPKNFVTTIIEKNYCFETEVVRLLDYIFRVGIYYGSSHDLSPQC